MQRLAGRAPHAAALTPERRSACGSPLAQPLQGSQPRPISRHNRVDLRFAKRLTEIEFERCDEPRHRHRDAPLVWHGTPNPGGFDIDDMSHLAHKVILDAAALSLHKRRL